MSQSTHQRLYDFAKTALINVFAHPYATVRQALSSHPIDSFIPFPFYSHSHSFKVCDLYCADSGSDNWVDAQIGHYIGIGNPSLSSAPCFLRIEFILVFVLAFAADASSSGIEQMREAWESHRKSYTAQFFQVDPSVVNFLLYVQLFLMPLTML